MTELAQPGTAAASEVAHTPEIANAKDAPAHLADAPALAVLYRRE